MTERKELGLAYLGLTFAAFFWAGNAVIARGTVGIIPPLAMSFWRWVIALLILLPFALPSLRREWRTATMYWRQLLPLALLSIGAYNTLLYLAAQSTTAANITLISATMPVAIALMARLLLGQRLEWRQWGGIGLALCGVAIIVLLGAPNAASAGINQGDIIIMAAVLGWGLYSVLLRRRPLPLHPLTVLVLLIILGIPMILPFYLWELVTRGGLLLNAQTVPALLYVGVFPSLLAYLFWNHGVSVAGPNRASIFIYLIPMFAVLMAGALLGEKLHSHHALGAAFILLGLYLSTWVRTIRPS